MLYYLQNIVNKNTCHIDWMSFDFQFKVFFSNLHLNKGIYSVTDQLSQSPLLHVDKFQVLSSHFSEVDELPDDNWATIV